MSPARLTRRRVIASGAAVAAAAGAAWFLLPRGPTAPIVVEPSPIDWGRLLFFEPRSMTVRIRNRSDRETLLHRVSFSCPCLAPARPPDRLRLPPGRETTLEVVIQPHLTAPGRIHKTMTVMTDHPDAKKIDVAVIGSIVDVVPARHQKLESPDGEPPRARYEVRGVEDLAVSVAEAGVTDPRLQAEVVRVEGGADVIVRPAPGAMKGPVSANLRLSLDVRVGDAPPRRVEDTNLTVVGTIP